jgi:hypothetical protein
MKLRWHCADCAVFGLSSFGFGVGVLWMELWLWGLSALGGKLKEGLDPDTVNMQPAAHDGPAIHRWQAPSLQRGEPRCIRVHQHCPLALAPWTGCVECCGRTGVLGCCTHGPLSTKGAWVFWGAGPTSLWCVLLLNPWACQVSVVIGISVGFAAHPVWVSQNTFFDVPSSSGPVATGVGWSRMVQQSCAVSPYESSLLVCSR